MKVNWIEANQGTRTIRTARNGQPATVRLVLMGKYTFDITHDQRGDGNGGVILQRAHSIVREVLETPERANADWTQNGLTDKEIALAVEEAWQWLAQRPHVVLMPGIMVGDPSHTAIFEIPYERCRRQVGLMARCGECGWWGIIEQDKGLRVFECPECGEIAAHMSYVPEARFLFDNHPAEYLVKEIEGDDSDVTYLVAKAYVKDRDWFVAKDHIKLGRQRNG